MIESYIRVQHSLRTRFINIQIKSILLSQMFLNEKYLLTIIYIHWKLLTKQNIRMDVIKHD